MAWFLIPIDISSDILSFYVFYWKLACWCIESFSRNTFSVFINAKIIILNLIDILKLVWITWFCAFNSTFMEILRNKWLIFTIIFNQESRFVKIFWINHFIFRIFFILILTINWFINEVVCLMMIPRK